MKGGGHRNILEYEAFGAQFAYTILQLPWGLKKKTQDFSASLFPNNFYILKRNVKGVAYFLMLVTLLQILKLAF